LKNLKTAEPAPPRRFPVCDRMDEAIQAIPRAPRSANPLT
jgi:hypothetical protein